MGRQLAIDVGNTRTKVGLFDGNKLVEVVTVPRFNVPALQKLIAKFKAKYVIIGSVKHLSKKMISFVDANDRYLLLSPEIPLPIEIAYKTPKTLGQDRLAAVVGAWSLYPERNTLVIDAGTCIKYDLVTADGVYLGGNISPGLRMRLKAMHDYTAKLPHVLPYEQHISMGYDTRSALQAGGCTGAIHEMEGFIQNYKKTFDNLNILLTGGDVLFFVNNLKTEIFTAPHLVLAGLNEILNHDVQMRS